MYHPLLVNSKRTEKSPTTIQTRQSVAVQREGGIPVGKKDTQIVILSDLEFTF